MLYVRMAPRITPQDTWEHRISPIIFTIIYFMCIVMWLAIGVMLAWQLWTIAVAETAVESYDHEYYREVAASRGEVCLECSCHANPSDLSQTFHNSYDLGFVL